MELPLSRGVNVYFDQPREYFLPNSGKASIYPFRLLTIMSWLRFI